jgi:hypothetical protein
MSSRVFVEYHKLPNKLRYSEYHKLPNKLRYSAASTIGEVLYFVNFNLSIGVAHGLQAPMPAFSRIFLV